MLNVYIPMGCFCPDSIGSQCEGLLYLCVLIIAAIGMSLTVYILRIRRASHLLERLLAGSNGHRLIGIVGPNHAIDDHALSPAPDR